MQLRMAKMFLMICGLASAASAQTTQPVDQAWKSAVQRFASALSGPNGADDCKTDLSDNCDIGSFKDPINDLPTLAAHASGANLLLAKAYAAPVTTLASDIAAAASSAKAVPDSIRKLFIPADSDMAKADRVASQWISRVLNLSDGQCTGVLIYLVGDPSQPDSSQPQALLVLLVGKSDSDGKYHITKIVFGEPQEAVEAYR